jgi:predicted transcriptional regulator
MSIHQTARALASHQRYQMRNRQQCILLRSATEIGVSRQTIETYRNQSDVDKRSSEFGANQL